MLKRNIAILVAGGLLGAQAGVVGADDGDGDSNVEILPSQLRYLEQREAGMGMQEDMYKTVVNINASTKYVTTEREKVLLIKNDKGQSFTWKADTFGEDVIPLSAIAPQGFVGGDTQVYVRNPADFLSAGD